MKNVANGVRWVLQGRGATAATLQTALARVLILAINMGTGIITARSLGPQGRGEQAAIILWPQLLAYLMTLGLPAALRYNLKRYPEEKSELFSATLLLSVALGILAALIGIVFIPQWLGQQYSPEVVHFAQWFMLTAPVGVLWANLVAALEATDDFTTANQGQYLTPLFTLIMLLALLLAHGLTPFNTSLAYTLAGLPIFLWILNLLWKRFRPRWHNLGGQYRRLLSYGLRAYGIDLLGTLAGQMDQALVVGLLSPASMGMYAVALSLSRMLDVFQGSIITVLFPKTAARPIEEVIALTGRAARVGMACSLITATGAMLVVPTFLQLVYGSQFIGALPVFRILTVEVVIGGSTWVLAQAFMALGRPGTITIMQGIGLGLTVPLLLILIPRYELVGAGLAILCSTIIRFIFMLASYPLILKVRPPSLLITRDDFNFVLQALQLNRG